MTYFPENINAETNRAGELGRSRMCLILQETKDKVLKPCKSIQESSEEVLCFKSRQMYLSRFKM